MAKYQKTLAIDFGTQRIGLAVSYGSLAEPLEVIANNNQTIHKIKEVCQKTGAEKILIGLSEKRTAQQTKKFAAGLKKEIGLPLIFFDETLSSQTAKKKLQHSLAKKSKQTRPIDHYAAAEILGEYLDTR